MTDSPSWPGAVPGAALKVSVPGRLLELRQMGKVGHPQRTSESIKLMIKFHCEGQRSHAVGTIGPTADPENPSGRGLLKEVNICVSL